MSANACAASPMKRQKSDMRMFIHRTHSWKDICFTLKAHYFMKTLQQTINDCSRLVGEAAMQEIAQGAKVEKVGTLGIMINGVFIRNSGTIELYLDNTELQKVIARERKRDLEWEWDYHTKQLKEIDAQLETIKQIEAL